MSEDKEKPLTGADADAQPTKPVSGYPGPDDRAGTNSNAPGGPDAVEDNVGGVQGSDGDVADGTDSNVQVAPIGSPAPEGHVGGGEIEWSELGRQPGVRGTGAADET